ncbi:aquaporin [Candidatus Saccharibacteria bacterium]|nr:aquaporin [Candidatus Saccharibacteria bacterium]
MFTRFRLASTLAEFLGTAALVLIALVLSEITPVSYFVATSLAITLAAIVFIFGPISGAHFNPAITFGMWTARRIGTLRATAYVAAQMLGGLGAWQLYQYLNDKAVPAQSVTFNTTIWLAEAVGAFVLALGITAAISRAVDSLQWAVTAGATYFVGIMIASTASAGYLNPAVAVGLRSWNAAYVLGPLVGALVAVNLYHLLFSPSAVPVKRKR